jgi:serine/threonine protein kinase
MLNLHAGDLLDHYRIENLVARSGMATIFKATDTRDGLTVAIKVPHPEMECDPLLFDRFMREIDIGRKLDHPGIRKVLGKGEDGHVYMAMEWVEGKLLREIMFEEKQLSQARAMGIVARISDALDYAHEHGVVHRDLKPENIMVDADDNIKLIDFGIAGQTGSKRLTFAKLSNVMGTPDYISPEQVKGRRGDGRADIYAAGVMLYEMVTGKTPFTGDNPFQIMNDRLLNNPVPPREIDPSITPQLQEIVYRALERDPKNRYARARELAQDLEHPEQVGVADRPEMREWKKRKASWPRTLLFYAAMAMIPVVIFGLLLYVARH